MVAIVAVVVAWALSLWGLGMAVRWLTATKDKINAGEPLIFLRGARDGLAVARSVILADVEFDKCSVEALDRLAVQYDICIREETEKGAADVGEAIGTRLREKLWSAMSKAWRG